MSFSAWLQEEEREAIQSCQIQPSNSRLPMHSPQPAESFPPHIVVEAGLSGMAHTSFFQNAQNFHLESFVYNEAPRPLSSPSISWERGWARLVQQTAPNALHDSGARFDAPKCDEDTRVGVVEEILGWIMDRESPSKLLCMTGAAGAGKSCLQQTIAERCQEANILASAFFFWKGDPTRNNTAPFVATIAYQLGHKNLNIRALVGAAVDRDPLVFSRSLAVQMTRLVVDPINHYQSRSGEGASQSLPYAILIDGLDECEKSESQLELLQAIKTSFLDSETAPFRIFLASRPEWPIQSALDPKDHGFLWSLTYHIRLSDDYDATEDIRRMLWRRLRIIGARFGNPLWPTESDIEKLVHAASGQFIYAATVIKYVSERRSTPFSRLRALIAWRPSEGQKAGPFAALDLVYAQIIATAKAAYEDVDTNEHNFVLLLRAYVRLTRRFAVISLGDFETMELADAILGLEEGTWRIVISDLGSVMTTRRYRDEKGEVLRFYHKSFEDFFFDERRAAFNVPKVKVEAFIVDRLMRSISAGNFDTNSPSLSAPKGKAFDPGTLIFLLDMHVRDVILELMMNDESDHAQELRGHVCSTLMDFTRADSWDALQAGFDLACRSDNAEKVINLRTKVLYLSHYIGVFIFGSAVSPELPGYGAHCDAGLGATIQRWLFGTFNQIHRAYVDISRNLDDFEFTKVHLEAPSCSLSVVESQNWFTDRYEPSYDAMEMALIDLENYLKCRDAA